METTYGSVLEDEHGIEPGAFMIAVKDIKQEVNGSMEMLEASLDEPAKELFTIINERGDRKSVRGRNAFIIHMIVESKDAFAVSYGQERLIPFYKD